MQWDIIDLNPAFQIRNLKVSESRANIPATIEQHKKIKEYLKEIDPDFLNYIATIYHTGMRPKEILLIQIKMIDLYRREIVLPSGITKTDIERVVPINQHFYKMLVNFGVQNLPKDYYLFGSFREKGKGNVGSKKDFICGTTPLKRDTATKRWKKLVKDDLNINVNMYSEKHRGANDKIVAGIDLDALRELYGHKSKLMTMRYAKVVKEVYRKEIMDKSPDF